MNLKTVIASVFKVLAFLLVLAVLLPSTVKLAHAFNHHKHEVCDSDNENETHFHESDLECDFYKFKLTKNQFLVFNNYDVKVKFISTNLTSGYYKSYNNHQQLITFLRGPPTLV